MKLINSCVLVFLFTMSATVVADLAPKKVSDLVMLKSSNTDCMTGEAIDMMVNANGATVPLNIPAGQALVVQSVQWKAFSGMDAANDHIEVSLILESGSSSALVVRGGGSIADSKGGHAGSLQLNPGVIVRSNQTLCLFCQSINDADEHQCLSTAQGFLAKDK